MLPEPLFTMKTTHHYLKSVCVIGLQLVATITAIAATTPGGDNSRTGSIVGRVYDVNTNAAVTGATVTDQKSGREVYADREGQFRMDNVSPGSVELSISSTGYETKEETVEVSDGGATPVRIFLGEKAVVLGALVVEGYREGWAKALQQKRNAVNFKDMLSSDAAGKLPDNNVGEALSRLPGVSLEVENGEGHYISVRGTDPSLNMVTLNGTNFASSPDLGRDGRSAPMDFLDASLISQVEVIKTLTPDMDGTSLGGTINILTPSGFDHEGRFIAGGFQYGGNQADDKPIVSADLAYTNVIPTSGGKLGVALTANYNKRNTRNDRLYNIWSGNETQPILQEPRLSYWTSEREKYGASLNLDYRTDDGTRVYLQTFYNHFTDDYSNNYKHYSARGTVTPESSTKITSTQFQLRDDFISSHRLSDVVSLVLGGSKDIGDFVLDGEVSYSDADDRQPKYYNLSFRGPNVTLPGGYFLDYSSPNAPIIAPQAISYVSTVNPPARQVRRDNIKNTDQISTASVNLRRDFEDWLGGKTGFLKVGTKYSHRVRDNNRNVGLYTAPGKTLADFDPGITTPNPVSIYDGRLLDPNAIDTNAVKLAFDSFLSQGALQYNKEGSLSNGGEDTFNVVEDIWAGYAMASVDLTPDLAIIGGFRYEHTKAPLQGPLFSVNTTTGDPELANRKVTFNYGEFLPNLQLRYQVSKTTQFRAAVTRSFGRPRYNDQVPSGAFDKDGGELTTGNPQLKPYESLNYDVALDHYFESGSAVSVAAFYKTIDNPIYSNSSEQTNVTFGGIFFPVFTTSTKENGKSASVHGVELSAKIPFSAFTDGFIDGFGVDVNTSFMDSSVQVFSRPGVDLRLFQSPKRVYNFGLFYEKYGFSARLAYNYKSDSLQSIGSSAYQDVYLSSHFNWDAQVSYRFTENYSMFVNWQNITDETVDSYTASSSDRIYQSYWFGSNIRVGVRFRF